MRAMLPADWPCPSGPGGSMSFVQEVRRRKIFQVAAVYAVVAWLLAQVVVTIEAPLSLPGWVDTFVIVCLGIGFPITLVISWAFNVTSDGLVRESESPTMAPGAGRGIEYVLIGVLAVAVVWLLYRDLGGASPAAESAGAADAALADGGAANEATIDRAGSDVLPNSLAVLLCDNFSTDPENAFFAASLHEELLNQLFKISNLNVISRTSVLQYAGDQRPSITLIADELRVGSVIECSVAFGDGRIVISVQLIDGESGVHIWSERYNREFADVFGIQADIAMNVANALAVEFSADEQEALARVPTESPEAYALYLEARSLANIDFSRGVDLLDRALAFDPDFAAAHLLKGTYLAAGLVNTTGSNAVGGAEREDLIRLASVHIDRAFELDPSLPGLDGVAAINAFTWRWSEQLAMLGQQQAELQAVSIWLHSYTGAHEEALARANRGLALDPRNWNAYWNAAVARHYSGESDEAARLIREGIALAPTVPVLPPTVPVLHSWLAYIETARGNGDVAAQELARAEQLLNDTIAAVYLPEMAYVYSRIGRTADVERILARLEALPQVESGEGGRVMIALALGDRAAAVAALEAALVKVANHQIDEGFWNLMNVRMNVTGDPVLEESPFVELRSRLRGE